MRMKSCAYCGRMHPVGYVCPKKPTYKPKDKDSQANKIRSTYAWQQTRERIKQRDNYLCQCCIRNYPGTRRRIEYDNLSVHHIISLENDSDKAFIDENLITLCDIHHEMAEAGEITAEALIEIAKEQGASASLGEVAPGL